MNKIEVTFTIDTADLRGYTDTYLATLWHVAQANPAPITDEAAGQVAEHIGREIIRRWLMGVEPVVWAHQGRHYAQMALSNIARYVPGGPSGTPEWHKGTWVPKGSDEDEVAGGEQP